MLCYNIQSLEFNFSTKHNLIYKGKHSHENSNWKCAFSIVLDLPSHTLEHFTFYYSFTEQSPWTIQWHTPTTRRNFNPELYDGVRGFSEHCSFIVYKQNIYIFLFSLPTPLTVFRYFLSFSTQLHAWKNWNFSSCCCWCLWMETFPFSSPTNSI